MAIAQNVLRKKYENLSLEDLENEYELLKKSFCFENKEEQIEYIIKNYLNVSHDVNNNSKKIVLEELLKEKTGKDYIIEPKIFDFTLIDVINTLTDYNNDPFWTTLLVKYFESLSELTEKEKINFLIQLIQDKNNFNEFTKEITKSNDNKEIYEKYKNIAQEFYLKNKRIS